MINMQEPIRVLCVFAGLHRGGAETMCMELYHHIDRSKVQFDFVKHTSEKHEYEDEILSLGGKIYEAPPYRVYNELSYCGWWKEFLRNHPEYQIIHGHYFTVAPVYFKVCQQMGRITIGHSHCTRNTQNSIRRIILDRVLKKLERRSDYCLACSKEAGEWLFPNKSFTILKNAIDVDKFAFSPEVRKACREEFRIPEESLVVGTVGRLNYQKNPFGVIEIFKAVHCKSPTARFLWVGDGNLRNEVEDRLRQEGLSDVVVMTGVRSDVSRLLQAMDVFVLPSLYEGLPVVAIEAQASGLLCFLSGTITQEVAVTDLCSFLPLGQPELWADTILAADKEQKNRIQQVKDAGYDIAVTSKWLEEFYCNCANSVVPQKQSRL